MKVRRVVLPAMLCLLGSLSPATAQPKKPSGKPAPMKLEDPELYFAFFRSHNAVDQQIQASSPAAATQLSSTTAALYGISVGDLPKLTAQTRTFMTNLAAWSTLEQGYVAHQQGAKKLPDIKTLIVYQHQRQRLVMNAHGRIHGALTRTSWAGLYAYINGSFKAGLKQTAGAAK
jgi:hypothetical protein